jgi:hypothetical protein
MRETLEQDRAAWKRDARPQYDGAIAGRYDQRA